MFWVKALDELISFGIVCDSLKGVLCQRIGEPLKKKTIEANKIKLKCSCLNFISYKICLKCFADNFINKKSLEFCSVSFLLLFLKLL